MVASILTLKRFASRMPSSSSLPEKLVRRVRSDRIHLQALVLYDLSRVRQLWYPMDLDYKRRVVVRRCKQIPQKSVMIQSHRDRGARNLRSRCQTSQWDRILLRYPRRPSSQWRQRHLARTLFRSSHTPPAWWTMCQISWMH